jgi:hypothetical protein
LPSADACHGIESAPRRSKFSKRSKHSTRSEFDTWTARFAEHIARKGKVQPGKYRAFGYKPPGHFLRDAQLA